MFPISTMKLSMELLRRWRSNSQVMAPSDQDCGLPIPAMKVAIEPKTSAGRQSKNGKAAGLEDDLQVHKSPRIASPLLQNTNDPQNEAFGRRRKKDSPQNRSLDELTSSGKRIRRKSQELRSMVLEKRSESADGQLSADFVVDILDEADRLNEQLVSTISALSQWTARIEKLEENQSKDTNLFQSLAERVTQLERRRDVCSSMASSSSMANQHGDLDEGQCNESITWKDAVHGLSPETQHSIEDIKDRMDKHGLSRNHFVWWSATHKFAVSDIMVANFLYKKLREEQYKRLMPLMNAFLNEACRPEWIIQSSFLSEEMSDLIDHYQETLKDRGITVTQVSRWLQRNKKMKNITRRVYEFFAKRLPEKRSRLFAALVGEYFDVTATGKHHPDRILSAATHTFIDTCKQKMNEKGLLPADLMRWCDKNHPYPNSRVHKFMNKKLAEGTCREMIPVVGRFLADVGDPCYALHEIVHPQRYQTSSGPSSQGSARVDEELDPLETHQSSPESDCMTIEDSATDWDSDRTEIVKPSTSRGNRMRSGEFSKGFGLKTPHAASNALADSEKPLAQSMAYLFDQLDESADEITV